MLRGDLAERHRGQHTDDGPGVSGWIEDGLWSGTGLLWGLAGVDDVLDGGLQEAEGLGLEIVEVLVVVAGADAFAVDRGPVGAEGPLFLAEVPPVFDF